MPRSYTLTRRKERERQRLLMRKKKEKRQELGYNEQLSSRDDVRFHEYATNFENSQKNLNLEVCNVCHRRWFDLHIGKDGSCKICHTFAVKNELNIFSGANNMDPGSQPDVLKKLSFVEEQLIAQVHPVITVYRLKGGQFGYSGQIINFHQDITIFTTRLPHSIDTISQYIFVRRQDGEGYKDFIVNRDNVKSALEYLKKNNPWYRDIVVDESNLQSLPDNESIFHKIILSQEHQKISFSANKENLESECENQDSWRNNIYETGAPTITFKCNREAVNNTLGIQEEMDETHVLPWPQINTVPINEFTCDGYICRAFPTLFPTGKGDLKDARIQKVSNSQYFKFLMTYEDGRFARHPRFRFFAFNSLIRWTALRNGNICVKKNSRLHGIETIEQLQEQLKNDPRLYKSILSFNANIRSSSSYWYIRSRELLDMVEELGMPTIFTTLSSADLYWSEIYRIIDPNYNYANLNQNSEFVRKSKLLSSNPLIIAYFFHKRLDFFMEHFLKKYFKVKDFWYRIEFQHRGSPHMHGLFWFENAPDLNNLTAYDITRIQEVVKYFDEFISTWHPDSNQTYDVHPSKMHFTDVFNHDADYNHLIRAVQIHKCSKGYCLRKKKNSSEMICRFKYPKECVHESKIQFINGEVEYISKRNNSQLNSHSPQILKIWRANMDCQAIVSIHAVLKYIAKYASKCETRSEGMRDFIKQTVQVSGTNMKVQQIIQKVLIKMCAERDYSAQEIFWVLMSWPLYRSSRQFVSIKLSNNTWEQLNMNKEDGTITISNPLNKYQQRPADYENMSLKDFFTKTYKRGANYSVRKKPFILRIMPKLQFEPSSRSNEDYYKQQVLLNIPYRQLIDLNSHNSTWKSIYDQHFGKDVILRYECDNLLQDLEDEEDVEEIDQIDVDKPYDWMDVAAGPNNMQEEVDLGRREIDIAFHWNTISDVQVLTILQHFIEVEKAKEYEKVDLANFQYKLPNLNFSHEQQELINIFEKQLNFLCGNELETPVKRIVVQGKAGSGKSTVINYFTNTLNQTLGPSSYQLIAPTGAAAVNINGSTIHSKLLLRVNKVFSELGLHSLAQFQEEFLNCKFLFIDEVSMIGCSLLRKIDLRLRNAIPSRRDEPFGGLFVYFLGDIKQLPPVNDRPLYSDKIEGSEFLLEGKLLFTSSIQKYIFLSSSFRQNESQQVFRDILDRISDGESTVQDYKILMSRSLQTFSVEERKFFDDAIRLFATNADVNDFNYQKMKELRQPVAYIPAIHNCSKAKSATSEFFGGLEPYLMLSIGSKVMLRSNLWVQKGLVNGALGYVEDIIYEEHSGPPDQMPVVIMVRFEKYTHLTYEKTGCVPIPPTTKFWKIGNVNCTRKQFPLQLAFAITIHKAQGLTLNKAVVDIGDKEISVGLTYVALSRVKSLQDLAFSRAFCYDRFSSIKKSHMLECRKREEIRMKKFVANNV